MITYDLAKQLKEAGFPEIINGRQTYLPYCNPNGSNDPKNGELICEPNLSELIESCGEHFHSLENWKITNHNWIACYIDSEEIYTEGQTPEEAVAKLWLKLKSPILNREL